MITDERMAELERWGRDGGALPIIEELLSVIRESRDSEARLREELKARDACVTALRSLELNLTRPVFANDFYFTNARAVLELPLAMIDAQHSKETRDE